MRDKKERNKETMLADDICAVVAQTVKDNFADSQIMRISVDANESTKSACVNVTVEKTRKKGAESKLEVIVPYILILVFGCITLWNLFKMPGCRPTRIMTYAEKQSCIVTNSVGGEIKLMQDAKGCVTNKWE